MAMTTTKETQYIGTNLDDLKTAGVPIDYGNVSNIDKSMYVDTDDNNQIKYYPMLYVYGGSVQVHLNDWIIKDSTGAYHLCSNEAHS